jgi:hypothetical protein
MTGALWLAAVGVLWYFARLAERAAAELHDVRSSAREAIAADEAACFYTDRQEHHQ